MYDLQGFYLQHLLYECALSLTRINDTKSSCKRARFKRNNLRGVCVCVCVCVSQEECARFREGVPYVKIY